MLNERDRRATWDALGSISRGGVLAHAARSLRIPRTTPISRLARAGIDPPARPPSHR